MIKAQIEIELTKLLSEIDDLKEGLPNEEVEQAYQSIQEGLNILEDL